VKLSIIFFFNVVLIIVIKIFGLKNVLLASNLTIHLPIVALLFNNYIII
jgi:hypothetical protein